MGLSKRFEPWQRLTIEWRARIGDAPVLVGFSGGLDSHVLLHFLVEAGFTVSAVYVHHGLHADADDWQQHCIAVAEQLGVVCHSRAVHVEHSSAEGVEARARRRRYQVFDEMMDAGGYLATGHHADDQLETVLLQLFRGSGVAGLAAMPAAHSRSRGTHIRPLLACSRADLIAYAQRYQLRWIDDSSNQDMRFDRNFLRHQVLPALIHRWPAIRTTVARSAQHCADAAVALQAVAQQDIESFYQHLGPLPLAPLMALPDERRVHALRYWLKQVAGVIPSQAQLQQLIACLMGARMDAQPQLSLDRFVLRRYQGCLYVLPRGDTPPVWQPQSWSMDRPLLLVGTTACITPEVARQYGVSHSDQGSPLTVCTRKDAPNSAVLKKKFQQARIPPWERAYTPLIYQAGQLRAIVPWAACLC